MYQNRVYSNGTPRSALNRLPTLDNIARGAATNAGATVVHLNIDSREVGTAVVSNGRTVDHGALSALKSNAGRRQMTALQISPGLITG